MDIEKCAENKYDMKLVSEVASPPVIVPYVRETVMKDPKILINKRMVKIFLGPDGYQR